MFKVIGQAMAHRQPSAPPTEKLGILLDEHGERSDAGFKEADHAIPFVIQCFHFGYCSTCGILCNQGLADSLCIHGEKCA